ncbi:pyruvate formate lyase family protein [Vallitalea pronyensis]|nr:pyruvate formate lyase family protein [Vallitalea pronyensis]
MDKIELMEKFTETYKGTADLSKGQREITCMKILFPAVFVPPKKEDYFVGRYIQLPVGIGLEFAHLGGGDLSMLGAGEPERGNYKNGPSYYGRQDFLERLKGETEEKALHKRIDKLIDYWAIEDTNTQMIKAFNEEHDLDFFDPDIEKMGTPIIGLMRLSGIQLDYRPLLQWGIEGLKKKLLTHLRKSGLTDEQKDFYHSGLDALDLLQQSIQACISLNQQQPHPHEDLMDQTLHHIYDQPPSSFHEAIQLMFLYSQLSGVLNYGRLDMVLGDYLALDIERGLISEATGIHYLESLWQLIHDVSHKVNGRVIIGGRGRHNIKASNLFAKCAIKATMNTKLILPQLSLRLDESVPEWLYDLALHAIEQGCTFPMLYNDAVNVPAVAKALGVTEEDACDYVPYGCGEYMLWGKSTGSPNVLINMVKALQLSLNKGYDNFDGTYRGGKHTFDELNHLLTFDDVTRSYYGYLTYLLDITLAFQQASYQYMSEASSFIYASLLMADCMEKGKPILDGGIQHVGGVNEFYGFVNVIDSLAAINKVVFDDQHYSLQEVVRAVNRNFKGSTAIQSALLQAPKYGNDNNYVDAIGIDFHAFACSYIKDRASHYGLDSFLAVNINNNTNTLWGLQTGASYDGRKYSEYLNPGNNPHSGRDQNGITAMLNSISKLRPDIHGGFVQHIKMSPRLFREERDKVKAVFAGYFNRIGGSQLMITVVDQAMLLEAQKEPEKHSNLIVRVGGFSARFVDIDRETQNEIISRTCH